MLTPLALRRDRDRELMGLLQMGAAGGGPRIIPASGSVPRGNDMGSQMGVGLAGLGKGLLAYAEGQQQAEARERALAEQAAAQDAMRRGNAAYETGVKEWRDPDTAVQGPGGTFTKDGIEYSAASYPMAGTGDVLVRGRAPGVEAMMAVMGENPTLAPAVMKARMDMAAQQAGKAPPMTRDAAVALAKSLDPEGKDKQLWQLATQGPLDGPFFGDYVKSRYTDAKAKAEKPQIFGNDRVGYYALGPNMEKVQLTAPMGAEPTPLQRDLEAAGFKRGTPEYRDAIIQIRAKPTVDMGDNYGTIPAGYQLARDPDTGAVRMEPIPGSPQAREAVASAEAEAKSGEQKAITAGLVTTEIDRALNMITKNPNMVTGIGGALLGALPGSGAHDLANILATLQGNMAFDKLQAMREASPTGGALGAVSDRELKLLHSNYGALVQSQSAEQLQYNLRRLHNTYNEVVHGKDHNLPRYDLKTGELVGPETSQRSKSSARYRLNRDGTVTDLQDGRQVVKKAGEWVPAGD